MLIFKKCRGDGASGAVRLFEVFYLLTQGFGLKNKKEEGMKKFILIALLALGLGFGLTLMVSTPSMAVHKGSDGMLTCGNCHTMHSSQGGTSGPAMSSSSTGSFILLRAGGITDRGQIHILCLQCHSQGGAQATDPFPPFNIAAPKVHLTTPWAGAAQPDYSTVGAGGDFATACGTTATFTSCSDGTSAGLGYGHSLGATAGVVPPGNAANTDSIATLTGLTSAFSCTACHDPHGTATTTSTINKFRNLKADTAIAAGAQNAWTGMTTFGDIGTSYAGAVAGTGVGSGSGATHTWPVYVNAGSQNTYKASNIADGNTGTAEAVSVGMSRFCAQCHGVWHEATAGNTNNLASNNQDWKRHPTQRKIIDSTPTSGGNVTIVDYTSYNTNTGSAKFRSTDTGAATKVPAAQNDGSTTYYANSSDDRVFCLSCHFAHGGPYYDNLRWNYASAVSSGSQTGISLASNVGCQQCHNR